MVIITDTVTVSDSVSCGATGPGGWCSGSATLTVNASDTSGHTVAIDGTYGGTGFHCDSAPCTVSLPEGSGAISYTGTCSAGKTASGSDSWKLDTTPPTVSSSLSGGTAGGGGWYTAGPVTMTCTGLDTPSGIYGITYGAQIANGNGSHTLSCTATDNAGNTASTSSIVKIDGVAPNVSLLCNGAACGSGWYTGNVTLTAGASDTLSGVAAGTPMVSTDGGASWSASATLSDGVHNVQARASDVAGNSGSSSGTVNVDTTPPTVGYSLSGGTSGGGGWYLAGPVTMTCTGLDTPSGIYGITYGAQIANGNGSHTLSCTATDNAGNTASTSSIVKIDGVAPNVSLLCNGAACGSGWYTGNVTLTAGASDTLSGVAAGTPLVSTDGGATWSASATLADGVHNVQARASDVAGNSGSTSGMVNVDTTAPSASIQCNGSACGSGWYAAGVSVSLSASDATSGLVAGSALISTDGGATWHASATLSDGVYNVLGRARDNAGNTANVSWAVQVDSTPPVITNGLSGGVMGSGGWYHSGPVTLTCNATDATSGVASIAYGTQTATANGATTLNCIATDHAGNSSSYSTVVSIDNQMPAIQFDLSGNYCTGGWYNSPVGVGIEAHDLFSGITSYGFSVNGGGNTLKATLNADGIYTLNGFATNGVGNTAHIGEAVQLDSTPPVSQWTTADDSWVGGKATFTGTSTDLMSGIKEVFVSTNNGKTWISIGRSPSWSFAWDTKSDPGVPDGAYTLLARADDNACNHEHTAKLTVNVDNTPPTLKLQDSFNLLGRSNQIFNTDAGSGMARAVATISGNGIQPVVITFDSPGASEAFSWDGRTGDGKVAPFGIYTVVVDAWDKVGNHSQIKGTWVRPAPQAPTAIPAENNASAVTGSGSTVVSPSTPAVNVIQPALIPLWLLMLPMAGMIFWLLASGVAFTRDRRGVELKALGRSVNEYLSQSKTNSKGGEND